jgi:hypothetical protein
VLSLSAREGLFWEQVWKDSANAGLAGQRKFPTVLMPGDPLELPAPDEGSESGGTEVHHKFSVKGTPARLRLRLRMKGEVVADKDVTLVVDGGHLATKTDADGRIDVSIPPQAAEVRMRIGADKGEYVLQLGWMTPIDSVSGLQARLFNLGYDPKGIDNDFGGNTRKAMQAFQKGKSIPTTSKPDQPTRDSLEQEYGC